MPGETLSLKCACGYVKHDVIHLGAWQNYQTRLLSYCGGLFILNSTGDGVTCKKCSLSVSSLEFHCSFCDRVTKVPVSYRVAKVEGRATVVQMSVHETIVFSS